MSEPPTCPHGATVGDWCSGCDMYDEPATAPWKPPAMDSGELIRCIKVRGFGPETPCTCPLEEDSLRVDCRRDKIEFERDGIPIGPQALDGDEGFDAGVRQAIEWLRAGYEYGTGPDWRERGAEWIAECYAEARRQTP